MVLFQSFYVLHVIMLGPIHVCLLFDRSSHRLILVKSSTSFIFLLVGV